MPKLPTIPLWMKVLLPLFLASFIVANRLADNASLLESFRLQVAVWGLWGVALFMAAYIAASFFFIPGLLLTLAAGALYGPLFGTVAASAASTLCLAGTFLVARHVAPDPVREKLLRHRRFRFLLEKGDIIEQYGAWAVVATRLVPIFPFAPLNYAFGLSRISFGKYLFWSWFCLLPGTALFVTAGDLLAQAAAGSATPWLLATFVLALMVALGLTASFVRHHFAFIRKAEEEDEGAPSNEITLEAEDTPLSPTETQRDTDKEDPA